MLSYIVCANRNCNSNSEVESRSCLKKINLPFANRNYMQTNYFLIMLPRSLCLLGDMSSCMQITIIQITFVFNIHCQKIYVLAVSSFWASTFGIPIVYIFFIRGIFHSSVEQTVRTLRTWEPFFELMPKTMLFNRRI